MTTVYLELKCKRTGKLFYREINPLQEFFRKNPLREIVLLAECGVLNFEGENDDPILKALERFRLAYLAYQNCSYVPEEIDRECTEAHEDLLKKLDF